MGIATRGRARNAPGCLALVGLVLLAGACAQGGTAPSSAPAPAAQQPAAAPAAAPPPAAAAPLVHLKYGTQRPVADAAIYISDARGYFKEAGVDVELIPFGSATEMVPALATGQLDVGGITPVAAVVNAVARGVDVKTVAERGSQLPGFGYSALVIRKDLIDHGRVKDYPDLKGLHIGVGAPLKASGGSVQLLAALEKGGLQWEDVDAVGMDLPDLDVSLQNGGLDAMIIAEPWVSNAVAGGYGVRWKGIDEVYPNNMLAGLGYSPVMTQQRPDAARAFMVAYVRGVRDYLYAVEKGRGKDELYSIIAQYSVVKDRAVLERMTLHGVKPDPFLSRESVARDVAAYRRWGTVTEDVSLDQLIDDQWVQYAADKLGPYR
jgi:NitT/TauT family transport system substrate-binding protein